MQEIRREKAQRHLRNFITQAWHVLEPGREFVPSWHIDAMCEHLEAISRGDLHKLLINVPPGFTKSLTVSVFWNAWEWTTRPEKRFVTASHGANLSTRDARKTRQLIVSPWYQQNWGDVFSMADDENRKTAFENDKTGYRVSSSVGTGSIGIHGDRGIVDDPHNTKQALSPVMRKDALNFWDQELSPRIDDIETTGGLVIVMQRLHQNDLSGHVLDQGGYEHLMLPMEFEAKRKCQTSLGFEDPRSKEGELLCPARFSEQAVGDLKKSLGSYSVAGQLQQRPAPRGGGMFKRAWFDIVDAVPAGAKTVRYWDLAATEETPGRDPDYTAGGKVCESDGVYTICDMRRGRLSPLGVEKLVKQTAELDGRIDIYMEQEPGASGVSGIDHYARKVLVGYAFRGDRPTGSKIERANPLSAAAEAGNVKLLRGDWNKDFLDEIETFPNGAHDDQVDTVSGAFHKLAKPVVEVAG